MTIDPIDINKIIDVIIGAVVTISLGFIYRKQGQIQKDVKTTNQFITSLRPPPNDSDSKKN